MKRKYYRLQSEAARWSPRFGWCGLFLLAGGIVLHRIGWMATSDLAVFAMFPAIAALIGLVMAVKGIAALWQYGHKGGVAACKGGLLSAITLAPLVFVATLWMLLPPLYEVSTDLETPPAFLPGLRPADALPVAASLAAQAEEQFAAWPQLSSRRYDGSPDKVLMAVLSVISAKGWTVTGQKGDIGDDTEFSVQAAAMTWVMGFVSDIVIRLTDEGDTIFVDIRAASRYLPRDFGTNARFAMAFMGALDAEVLLTPVEEVDS